MCSRSFLISVTISAATLSYDVIITDSSKYVGPAASLPKTSGCTHERTHLDPGRVFLPLLRDLLKATRELFLVAEHACTTIQTYLGQISFVLCLNEASGDVQEPVRTRVYPRLCSVAL